jgi:hypothetical protein
VPDPADYSGLYIMRGHAAFYSKVMAAVDLLRADGAQAQAKLLLLAFEDYWAMLGKIAVDIAAKARIAIVQAEQDTRVRPDSAGGGGDRLEDYIGHSEPLPQLPGSVGVNDEQMLRDSPVHWWWTNEEGYSGFVGEERQGYFFGPGGGGSGFIPSSHMAGQHPVFKPYGGRAPTMVIENAIPARRFVERGYDEVMAEWHAEVDRARASFIAEMERILRMPLVP